MEQVEYPTYIEIPEGYWTITTTIDSSDVDIYWHHNEE